MKRGGSCAAVLLVALCLVGCGSHPQQDKGLNHPGCAYSKIAYDSGQMSAQQAQVYLATCPN